MTWRALVSIIAEEAGEDAASRIEDRARELFGGKQLFVRKKKIINVKRIDSAASGKPKEAAKKLDVHYSTVYRVLNRRIIR